MQRLTRRVSRIRTTDRRRDLYKLVEKNNKHKTNKVLYQLTKLVVQDIISYIISYQKFIAVSYTHLTLPTKRIV